MKSLTMFCILVGCIAPAFLSGCAIDITGSALSPFDRPPTCYLAAHPADILVGQSTTITCTASDVDSDAISYAWHAPVGCTLEGDGAQVQASPSHSGFFYVSVTVSDKDGEFTAGIAIGVAQRNAPDSLWTRPVSTGMEFIVGDVVVTSDGGYGVVGNEECYLPHSCCSMIMVTDVDLQLLWTAEGAPRTVFRALAQAHDGGFIVVGSVTDSLAHPNHISVSCYDPPGECEWQRQYGVNPWDVAYGIVPVNDSTFVVWIGTELLWVTARGDTLRKCSVSSYLLCGHLTAMPNGDIVAVAIKDSASGRFLDITRLNADGALLWRRLYRGYYAALGVAASPTPDGGLMIVQADDMIRVNAYGDTLWQRKCFYGNTWSLAGFKDVLVDEQGYLLAGHSDRTLVGRDGSLVVRTDYEGNLVWYHSTNDFEYARKILCQTDGSLVVLHGRDHLTKFAAE